MTGLVEAAERLADILVVENTALRALDLPRVAQCLAEKTAAVTACQASDPNTPAVSRPMVERLRALAAENRLLLERAIAVQNRVIGMIAGAMPRPPGAQGYGATGGRTRSQPAVPFAVLRRA